MEEPFPLFLAPVETRHFWHNGVLLFLSIDHLDIPSEISALALAFPLSICQKSRFRRDFSWELRERTIRGSYNLGVTDEMEEKEWEREVSDIEEVKRRTVVSSELFFIWVIVWLFILISIHGTTVREDPAVRMSYSFWVQSFLRPNH